MRVGTITALLLPRDSILLPTRTLENPDQSRFFLNSVVENRRGLLSWVAVYYLRPDSVGERYPV